MRARSAIVVVSLLGMGRLVACAAAPAKSAEKPVKPGASPSTKMPDMYAQTVAPMLKKYCVACHSGPGANSGVVVDLYKNDASLLKARSIFEHIASNIKSQHMPPKGSPMPTQAERDRVVSYIETRLSTADCNLKDPGRVTMRRLNRAEYNNTTRDLLGVDMHLADDFPSDDVGYGFDNIGDVLSISPLLMEKYMAAAGKLAHKAIVAPEDVSEQSKRFSGAKMPDETAGDGVVLHGKYRALYSNGEVNATYTFPAEGDYILRTRAYGDKAADVAARMAFRLDGKDLTEVDVPADEAKPGIYETKLHVAAGKHQVAVRFTNDFYDKAAKDPKNKDRNLYVEYLDVVGPLGQMVKELPESHRRIMIVQPTATNRSEAARKILSTFMRRAYRRPPTTDEVERVAKYVDMAQKEGDSFERGIQLAVQAVLVSPNFLFRVETDPPRAAKQGHAISDWELATRLSYFLWSSTPDDALLAAAEKGTLRKPVILEAQVRRMLRDSKAHALVENFGDQWLTLRNLRNVNPDPKRFPNWSEQLRADMLKETEMYFENVMREDRSVLEFLNSNYTFLNERMAKHYGIAGVTGEDFRKVELTGDQRGGVLTQASILTITSNPTRTSPVKRGKWILDQVLGTPPPPPPPNVPELKADTMLTGTLRQKMEQHRVNPSCASCHARMDPLGFGLENFDAVGAWRTEDGGAAVDASGVLPDGKSFQTPAQLKTILLSQKGQFTRNLAEQLTTFALGRGLEYYDKCAVNKIASAAAGKGYRMSAIILGIVGSEPFQMRRGEEAN